MSSLKIVLATFVCCATVAWATMASAGWAPAAYADEDVLEFYTITEDGDGHWSKVWLVVADDDVYIRLGSRAGDRIDGNTTKPYVKIRIAGEEFDKVLLEEAPDKVEQVAQLMGEKYWSDMFIKYVDHPKTLRLIVNLQTSP